MKEFSENRNPLQGLISAAREANTPESLEFVSCVERLHEIREPDELEMFEEEVE
jgi:hypothetical protein